MANYKYEVRDSNGQINSGVVQASSVTEASSIAVSHGGYVLNIAPVANGGGAWQMLEKMHNIKVERGPSLKDVMNFTNQLAVMTKAGISIRSALEGIAEQIENVKFRTIIEQIKMDVESGQPFSDALNKHPKTFSPLYVNMVRASELSGNFAHMLERISESLAQQVETRSMLRGAMIYPAIIALMAISATTFLLTFVLPKFGAIFEGKDAILPGPTLALMTFSEVIRDFWYVILLLIGLTFMGLYHAVHTPLGAEYWDRLKLRIPVLRQMLRALYITRGLNTMGELVNAGVPMLETLTITAEVSGNILYKRMWLKVHHSVQQGNKIAQPLSEQKLLPSNVLQMISAGEESGKLGEIMRDVAEFYAKELRATIKMVTAMIEPIMIIIVGVIVGFIAMSIILPIFKMSSLAK